MWGGLDWGGGCIYVETQILDLQTEAVDDLPRLSVHFIVLKVVFEGNLKFDFVLCRNLVTLFYSFHVFWKLIQCGAFKSGKSVLAKGMMSSLAFRRWCSAFLVLFLESSLIMIEVFNGMHKVQFCPEKMFFKK